MPELVFLGQHAEREKRVDAPDGGDLLALADELRAPVVFSCRSACCGSCQVQVLEGAELLEPPGPDEAELLELLHKPELGPTRLACQAQVRPVPGRVVLRNVQSWREQLPPEQLPPEPKLEPGQDGPPGQDGGPKLSG